MNKHLILTFAFVFLVSWANGQKKIKLTKPDRQKPIYIENGMRIVYALHGDATYRKGVITTIDPTFFVADGKTIAYEDLAALGRKRHGSGFLQFLLGTTGFGSIISAFNPPATPSCQGCQTVSTTDDGAVAGQVLIGVALVGLSINTAVRNSAKDVTSKWKLEVVD
ncbi:MAG: hypothetical protein JSS79_07535 [Bacteroidetes bacterium]|nr:hypothetical protein [Bacteroidota bacterium]